MKKTLITTAVALSAAGIAFAQNVPVPVAKTMPVQPNTATAEVSQQVLTPMATGDARIDEQLRALHKEMEAKIQAIRQEYLNKVKAIIGQRRSYVASTTPPVKQYNTDPNSPQGMQALQQEFETKVKALQQEYDAKKKANINSSEEVKRSISQDFEADMKTLQQEYDAKKKALLEGYKYGIKPTMDASTQPAGQGTEVKKAEVRGASTSTTSNVWGFFRRFFSQAKPLTSPNQ